MHLLECRSHQIPLARNLVLGDNLTVRGDPNFGGDVKHDFLWWWKSCANLKEDFILMLKK
jgi:hypothetical protein